MDERKPYNPYTPNEPAPSPQRHGRRTSAYERPPAEEPTESAAEVAQWASDAWDQPVPPERSYAQRTWDEEEYPVDASEPPAASQPQAADAEVPEARRSTGENPYIRPTWDESAYPNQRADGVDRPSQRPAALHFDADADTSPNTVYASTGENQPSDTHNPYARPTGDPAAAPENQSERFAPPLRYVLPEDDYVKPIPLEANAMAPEPNIYKRRGSTTDSDTPKAEPLPRAQQPYRVETDAGKRRRHPLRAWLIALAVIAVLGAVAYVERDYLLDRFNQFFGVPTTETTQRATGTAQPVTGYDPAPVLQASDRARKGIAAVAGNVALESYAVTNRNVIARVDVGDGLYDYYLFASADGKLLGYYDGLAEGGFLVCPDDVFYVAMPPYLIDNEGQALLDTSRYAQSVGDDPVLGPMINGWALICDADYTTFNYVNADGAALSTLWFSKAYPFTADSTVAYVDTGNVTDPEERYALYELRQDGTAALWQHASDMSEVLGCACGVVQMSDGTMILLDGTKTVLCTTDDAAIYVDCGAIVARDPETGKYGLFVNGEPFYDFDYDDIAPMETTAFTWHEEQNGFYRQYTVSGMAYPLPLSHYFRLVKGEEEEMVALSTSSIYPLLLSLNE